MPLKTYDESLAVLRRGLDAAKLGHMEKIEGLKRLDQLVRAVEQRYEPIADFEHLVQHEHAMSPSLDGKSVLADKRPARRKSASLPRDRQLSLFLPQSRH